MNLRRAKQPDVTIIGEVSESEVERARQVLGRQLDQCGRDVDDAKAALRSRSVAHALGRCTDAEMAAAHAELARARDASEECRLAIQELAGFALAASRPRRLSDLAASIEPLEALQKRQSDADCRIWEAGIALFNAIEERAAIVAEHRAALGPINEDLTALGFEKTSFRRDGPLTATAIEALAKALKRDFISASDRMTFDRERVRWVSVATPESRAARDVRAALASAS